MRLHLIRHGQTASNTGHHLDTAYPGAPLDETGQHQALDLAASLTGEDFDAIYSSDLVRAVQTATPLAEGVGLEVRQNPGFREISAGDYEMDTDWQPYIDALFAWAQDPERPIPGGESAVDVLARFDAAVAEAAKAGDSVVVVSHEAVLRIWIPQRAKNITVEEVGKLPLRNTDIICLDGNPDDGWDVISWAGAHTWGGLN